MMIRTDSIAFKTIMTVLAVIGVAIATLPIFAIVLMSFSPTTEMRFPPEALSLHWYGEALALFNGGAGDASAWSALTTSLLVGLSVMVISILVCVPLSYVLMRQSTSWNRVIETLVTLPLTFPLVALGLAFLLLAEALPFDIGIARLVIPHLTLAMPFVLRNCLSALNGIGTDIEDAAISLGSSPIRAAIDVILPLMRPGIIAGMTFAFVVSFNEFTVTFFMYTIDFSTLPLWMYSRTVSSLDPTALALSSLIIVVDIVIILAIDRIAGGTKNIL
jgi:putative spermidine/putrescine transport system permease protein